MITTGFQPGVYSTQVSNLHPVFQASYWLSKLVSCFLLSMIIMANLVYRSSISWWVRYHHNFSPMMMTCYGRIQLSEREQVECQQRSPCVFKGAIGEYSISAPGKNPPASDIGDMYRGKNVVGSCMHAWLTAAPWELYPRYTLQIGLLLRIQLQPVIRTRDTGKSVIIAGGGVRWV